MPYVVTTRRASATRTAPPSHNDVFSRREVATLEQARRTAGQACLGSTPLNLENIERARTLPDSGGTVGPLPDGTVIEVARMEP
jgi:hypothetical protein